MGLMEGLLKSNCSDNRTRLLTVGAIVLSFSLTIAILTAYSHPATGYEVSIYAGTPTAVWLILIISMMGSIAILLSSIIKYENRKKLSIGALIVAFLSFCSIIGLIIIRGYFAWTLNGDPATHLSLVNQTIHYQHLNVWNPYPILHLISAELTLLTDMDILYLHMLLPFVVGALTPLFYYVLANQLFQKRHIALLAALLSMLLSQGWFINFTPNHLANMVFPLFLFITIKHASSPNLGTASLTVIALLAMTLMHPAAMIGLALLMTVFITYLDNREKISPLSILSKYNPVIISAVLLVSWNMGRGTIQSSITETTSEVDVITQNQSSLFILVENFLSQSFQFFDYLILQNVPVLLFTIGAVVYFFLINRNAPFNIIPEKAVLVSIAAIIAAMLLMYQFDLGFNPLRLAPAMMVLLIIVMGALLHRLKSLAKKWIGQGCAICIPMVVILMVFFLGLSTVYPSEIQNQPNYQSTGAEITGFHWTFNNGNTEYTISSITLSPFRFGQFLYYDYDGGLWNIPFTGNPVPPAHFGYYDQTSLSESFESSTYLLLGERDRTNSPLVFPFHLYSENDFAHLNFDPSVIRVYSSDGFNTLLID